MAGWSRKFQRSGYTATLRHELIKTALERQDKVCSNEDKGERPVHRLKEWKEKERSLEKERNHGT